MANNHPRRRCVWSLGRDYFLRLLCADSGRNCALSLSESANERPVRVMYPAAPRAAVPVTVVPLGPSIVVANRALARSISRRRSGNGAGSWSRICPTWVRRRRRDRRARHGVEDHSPRRRRVRTRGPQRGNANALRAHAARHALPDPRRRAGARSVTDWLPQQQAALRAVCAWIVARDRRPF
jgi:hypothetical protein